MIRNYLKVAVRYLTKHKVYTFINISGLSVAIACCLLIMLFVKSEWSFDRFHTKSDTIYRAWLEEHYQGELFQNTSTPIPLGPVLLNGLPEAKSGCRIVELRPSIKYNNLVFNDPVTMVDKSFFEIFDFKMVKGDPKNPFPTPGHIILTENAVKRYFGKESPIGEIVELRLGNENLPFTISGIAENPPLESTIQFESLISFDNAPKIWNERIITSGWSNVQAGTFIVLNEGVNISQINDKIAKIMDPLVANDYKSGEYIVRLQPLKDIHFNSTLPEKLPRPSNQNYSYILASLAILILLIACINFVTLSIGRSATRALEVGVRKVLGAERGQLIKQFWGEAFLLTMISLVAGLGIALLLQKSFVQLVNRQLSFSFDGFTIMFCILIAAAIALLAGVYPAFVLSGFKPVQVLKGKISGRSNMGFFRKVLVSGQFIASIVMIIATFSIGKQLNFLKNKDLGFNKEHIVVVATNKDRRTGFPLAALYRNLIEQNPDIISTTTSLYSMGEYGWMNLGYTDNQNVFRSFKFNVIDTDFIPAMGIKMKVGRAFSADNPADSNYIIVNEALVKEYGWTNPIGQRLPGKYEQTVLGVAEDFHTESLHSPIRSAILALKPDSIFRHSSDVSYLASPSPRISVRLKGTDISGNLDFLKSSWKKVAGDQEFDFKFLDESLALAYDQERRLSKIIQFASVLSIFIACMGLFGLATLVVARRTKEIGIRKVLGADITGLVTLLSKDFFKLVIVASLLAFPLAWWGLNKWLQDFAYKTSIEWWIFFAAAVLALTVTVFTVSIQAIKVAMMNPVKSLRTE
jgi:putative ABC transport system permease protein